MVKNMAKPKNKTKIVDVDCIMRTGKKSVFIDWNDETYVTSISLLTQLIDGDLKTKDGEKSRSIKLGIFEDGVIVNTGDTDNTVWLTMKGKSIYFVPEKDIVDLRCNSCNTTWQGFQKNGLFGCQNCYSAFNERLKVLLRRIHGSNKHIGNRPSNYRIVIEESDLKKLKDELEIAIKKEKYEHAAELRDRIRDLEANLNRM